VAPSGALPFFCIPAVLLLPPAVAWSPRVLARLPFGIPVFFLAALAPAEVALLALLTTRIVLLAPSVSGRLPVAAGVVPVVALVFALVAVRPAPLPLAVAARALLLPVPFGDRALPVAGSAFAAVALRFPVLIAVPTLVSVFSFIPGHNTSPLG